MPRVLLVEDDRSIREGLEVALRRHGHAVTSAADGERGLAMLGNAAEPPTSSTRPDAPAGGHGAVDIVVLDVMLPGIDGFEVCRRVRAGGTVPVIMLTARGDDIDIVSGLEAGADDYVVKPVLPRVLDARIRAVLRRTASSGDAETWSGDLMIDRNAVTVAKAGGPVALTPTEMRLLLTLSGSPGQVFSRQQLLRLVWEQDYLGDSRVVDACVQRVRAKIEEEPGEPVYIQTVRGFGYRFGPL